MLRSDLRPQLQAPSPASGRRASPRDWALVGLLTVVVVAAVTAIAVRGDGDGSQQAASSTTADPPDGAPEIPAEDDDEATTTTTEPEVAYQYVEDLCSQLDFSRWAPYVLELDLPHVDWSDPEGTEQSELLNGSSGFMACDVGRDPSDLEYDDGIHTPGLVIQALVDPVGPLENGLNSAVFPGLFEIEPIDGPWEEGLLGLRVSWAPEPNPSDPADIAIHDSNIQVGVNCACDLTDHPDVMRQLYVDQVNDILAVIRH